MSEFRKVNVDRYGEAWVNESGTVVIGKTGKPLSIHWRNADGYVLCRFTVVENGKKRRVNRLVHRLVAEAFIPNPMGLKEVNHIDGNKENNAASNLEWCTRQQNIQHAVKNGLMPSNRGEHNGRSIIDMETANRIRLIHSHGISCYQIAKALHMGWTTIDHIIKNDTWTQ